MAVRHTINVSWGNGRPSLINHDILVAAVILTVSQSDNGCTMKQERKPRSRTKPPEERREDLMNAAERQFLESGVALTTIDQITTGANVSKGTFYLYFSTKEEIHSALRERFTLKYVRDLEIAIAKRPVDDWLGKLAAWAKVGVAGFYDHGPVVDMLYHDHPQPIDWDKQFRIVQPLESLLHDGSVAGAWEINDFHFTAVFLFSGLHGIVDDALHAKSRVTRGNLVRKLEEIAYRVLALDVSAAVSPNAAT